MEEDNLTEKLIAETFVKARIEGVRCPHIREDNISCYCAKNLEGGEEISDERRNVCDLFSRTLYCWDKEVYPKCPFYQGQPI